MRRLLLLSLAFALAACPGSGRQDVTQKGPTKTSTTTGNPQEVPENSTRMNPVLPPQGAVAAMPTTEVQLTDYAINMPATMRRGLNTLRIINSGKDNHSFAIVGDGIGQQLSDPLTRGGTAQMDVNLKPGTYTVYCPIDGHRGRGMQRRFTVD